MNNNDFIKKKLSYRTEVILDSVKDVVAAKVECTGTITSSLDPNGISLGNELTVVLELFTDKKNEDPDNYGLDAHISYEWVLMKGDEFVKILFYIVRTDGSWLSEPKQILFPVPANNFDYTLDVLKIVEKEVKEIETACIDLLIKHYT